MRAAVDDIAERVLRKPPKVSPVPPHVRRPAWSVMIPVYNCAPYLAKTLTSVLAQAPAESMMQIEVVDDCSTDADVGGIVQRIGKGRIRYFRQEQNVGSLRNFHTCLERADGHLIHLLHGDDFVGNGFYRTLRALFVANPSIGAAFCRYDYVDASDGRMFAQDAEMQSEGILPEWLDRISERQRIQYVAMVVKRDVYERLGGFYGVEYGEDWEMWVRIAANYPVGYTPRILAHYRKHDASISGRSFLSGRNMAELTQVMHTIQHHLPEGRRTNILRKSRKFYAHYALRIANGLWKLRHPDGALAQARAAWRMQKDVSLLFKILKLYTRITLKI